MATEQQFKSFTTRRFRADLHYRLRLLSAALGVTQEELFNRVVGEGLDVCEAKYQDLIKAQPGMIPTQ